MEIQASHLRIGNWYNSVRFNKPVQCELSDLYDLCAKSDGAYNDPPINEMFEPIPFTKKWSEKLGAIIIKSNVHEFPSREINLILTWKNKTLEITKDILDDEWDSVFIEIPKYVHLFQNLYFALTNTELTIKK